MKKFDHSKSGIVEAMLSDFELPNVTICLIWGAIQRIEDILVRLNMDPDQQYGVEIVLKTVNDLMGDRTTSELYQYTLDALRELNEGADEDNVVFALGVLLGKKETRDKLVKSHDMTVENFYRFTASGNTPNEVLAIMRREVMTARDGLLTLGSKGFAEYSNAQAEDFLAQIFKKSPEVAEQVAKDLGIPMGMSNAELKEMITELGIDVTPELKKSLKEDELEEEAKFMMLQMIDPEEIREFMVEKYGSVRAYMERQDCESCDKDGKNCPFQKLGDKYAEGWSDGRILKHNGMKS